jgi:calcium-binding protein CML
MDMDPTQVSVLCSFADEDSDGTIDSEELQSFGSRVRVHMSEEEMSNLHRYCDIDSRKGVQFQEFVVLLCLAYLLFGPDVTRRVRTYGSVSSSLFLS